MTSVFKEKEEAMQEEVCRNMINGRTALGIELGSTRIKAVLVDEHQKPVASGSHDWESGRILWRTSGKVFRTVLQSLRRT